MTKFVGLKHRQYALEIEGGIDKKKTNGVKKDVTKTLTVDNYVQSLFSNKTIHSQKHQNYTLKQSVSQ
jgi:hypothetical protein